MQKYRQRLKSRDDDDNHDDNNHDDEQANRGEDPPLPTAPVPAAEGVCLLKLCK